MAEFPHLRHPFGRDARTGKVAVVEQSTDDHVRSQEWAVIMCPLGFREERPDFGWAWTLFAPLPNNLAPLEAALRRFVPLSGARVEAWVGAAVGEQRARVLNRAQANEGGPR